MSSRHFVTRLILQRRSIIAYARRSVAPGPMIKGTLGCPIVFLIAQPGCQGKILQCASVRKTDGPWSASDAPDRIEMHRRHQIGLTTLQEHDAGYSHRDMAKEAPQSCISDFALFGRYRARRAGEDHLR